MTTTNEVTEPRYRAQKTGITRTYVVRDTYTNKIVDTTGTYNSAARRAAKLNEVTT